MEEIVMCPFLFRYGTPRFWDCWTADPDRHYLQAAHHFLYAEKNSSAKYVA